MIRFLIPATALALVCAAPVSAQTQMTTEQPAEADQATPQQGGMGMGMGMAGGMGGMMKHHRRGYGRHGMGMMGGGGMPPGMMMMLFTLMDTDGNETLSMEEVLRPHERMFNRIDGDDDGELTLEEMQAFMQTMHGG